MYLKKFFNDYQELVGAVSIGSILGLRTFLGTIALTSLLVQSAHISVSSLLPNVMFGVILSCVIVSSFSQIPQSVSQPQDGPAVLLSTVLASTSAQFSGNTTTALLINAMCCLSAGCLLWLVGGFKLGTAARLLPYPVVGGFLAGSGLLMLIFALKPMFLMLVNSDLTTSIELTKSAFITLLFSFFTLHLSKHMRGALAMPMVALIFSIGVNFYLFSSGFSRQESIRNGWLVDFTAHESSTLVFPKYWEHFSEALLIINNDWDQLIGIAIVTLVSLLLILSSIELTLHKDVDINHELKVAGVSNIASSFTGGLISFTALSATLLAVEKGGRNRLTGIIVAAVCGLLIFGDLTFIEYVPKPIVNGILILMGYGLVKEWLLKNYSRLGIFDYLSIFIIATSIVIYGYIGGILIGICISVAIFVLRYSKIKVIRHELTGIDLQSRVVRSKLQTDFLKAQGSKTRILKLDGYLFFGSVHTVLTKIINLVESEKAESIILDFTLVESVDLAAIETINRAAAYTKEHQCDLFIANASSIIIKNITKTAIIFDLSNFHSDVDHALEYCENKILTNHLELPGHENIQNWLHTNEFKTLIKHMTLEEYSKNQRLFSKGEIADKLYYLDHGSVSIKVVDISGNENRVQTLLHGVLIGERSFITKEPHSANAIVDTNSRIYSLSITQYEKLSQTHPQVIQQLNFHIISTLSDRLLSADHLLGVLMAS